MINFEHTVLLCEAQYTVLMFSIEKSCLCGTQVLIPMVENLFTSYNLSTDASNYIYSINNLQNRCRYFLLKPQVMIQVIFPIFCFHHLLPTQSKHTILIFKAIFLQSYQGLIVSVGLGFFIRQLETVPRYFQQDMTS